MTPSPRSRRGVLSVAAAALLGGCANLTGTPTDSPGGGDTATPETPRTTFTPDEDWQAPADAPTAEASTTVLVENLEIPWDLAWGSNGDLFVTERVGRVSRFTAGELDEILAPEDAIDAGAVPPGHDERPWWVEGGEGGTLGVAVHPDYPDDPALFVYYTAPAGDGRVNRVSRFDVSADDPAGTETVLVDDITGSNIHNGGRIAFGPRGYLWVTTGDGGEEELAADPGSLAGSVLRITAGGDPAPGNPDVDGADPRVYTYGHRNPQGLVWLPDGTTVASEHGPTGFDEINRLEAGADYGWPDTREGADAYTAADGVHPPLANSGGGTSWAPTGSTFYTGDAVPSWHNRMLVGGLVSQQLLVVTLTPPDGDLPPAEGGERHDAGWYDDAYTATVHPVLKDELGRVRRVAQGPDGGLYAITSNRDGRAKQPFPREVDDVLVRLEAAG